MKTITLLLLSLTLSVSSFAQAKADNNDVKQLIKKDDSPDTSRYATLYLYRPKNAVGGLVGYNIYVNDSVICKLKNNMKVAVRLYKEGPVKIWPHTETKKVEVNIRFGEEYFIKFAMVSGLVGAHPELNLINAEQGKAEYTSMKGRKEKNNE